LRLPNGEISFFHGTDFVMIGISAKFFRRRSSLEVKAAPFSAIPIFNNYVWRSLPAPSDDRHYSPDERMDRRAAIPRGSLACGHGKAKSPTQSRQIADR
jgi:hypothetical protein